MCDILIFVFMETYYEKIKRIRKSKGLNQVDICAQIGITQPSFASIEAGRTKTISIELGKKIAKALDVGFNELFEIDSIDDTVEIVKQLGKEYEEAKKRVEELEETLNDKRKIIDYYEDTMEYLALFRKYSFVKLSENINISALELFESVQDLIQKEKGYVGITVNKQKEGFVVRFIPASNELTNELKKMIESIESKDNTQ